MNAILKQKKDIFEKRAYAVKNMNTLKDAVRFFVHVYNNRFLPEKTTIASWVIAEQASLVFGRKIEEYDIMYAAELLSDIRPGMIEEISPCKDKGHYLTFAKDRMICPGERFLLLEETERHFNPDSAFYDDVKDMIE